MNTLAERVGAALSRPGITASKVAREVGITPSSVTQWKNGDTKNIASDILFDAARAFEVDPEWLATGKGEMVVDSAKDRLSNEGILVGILYQELPDHQKRMVKVLIDSYKNNE